MIDAHAHLHDCAFDEDRDVVIKRAWVAGVEGILTIGTSLEESRQAIDCAQRYAGVRASVGIHPYVFNELVGAGNEAVPTLVAELRKLAQSSDTVVAIGECGLDYFSRDQGRMSDTQRQVQRVGFVAQQNLARALKLPLIIHTRPTAGSMDAYADIHALLSIEATTDSSPIILHCYMGDLEITKRFLDLKHVYFSFTGNITYKVNSASDRDRVIQMIPLDRLLIETDCPYLAPVPYRGKRNEPAYIIETARSIAEMKKVEYTDLTQQCQENARVLFPGIMYESIK